MIGAWSSKVGSSAPSLVVWHSLSSFLSLIMSSTAWQPRPDLMADIIDRFVTLVAPVVSYSLLGLTALLAILIYRIYLHPLSHVPGPKLAAATGLYEFYFDGCLGGKYYWEIMRMHDEFGKRSPPGNPSLS